MSDSRSKFLLALAYERLSSLEIASFLDTSSFDFTILKTSAKVMLIECNSKTARSLIDKLGGTYKIAKVCGESIDALLNEIPLPYDAKFNWTVSGYDCDADLLEETHLSVQAFLKSKSLGKSRFIPPNVETEDALRGSLRELKIKDLYEHVLSPKGKTPEGLDIVVAKGLTQGPLFGCTLAASDVMGFEKRDFSRSYQDPTITIGPRLGRVLVNLGMKDRGGTLLDPFCGLGTILQEALMTGRNVVGVDISQSSINKSRTNLDWLQENNQALRRLSVTLFRGNAMNLRKENMPRIDGIATEPILLPKFEKNPNSSDAGKSLSAVSTLYERALRVFRELLKAKSRIAVIAPVIIDDRGREHKLALAPMLKEMNFKLFTPIMPGIQSEYPFRVPTSKRKIIQRDVYVMTVG